MRKRVSRRICPAWLFTIVNGTLFINPALAGDADSRADDGLEEVVVTGWKRSLRDSAEIKRSATGVIDAISAQDIDRFPDTNLGEALQRITGISIERRNGEGATVTARGFGPDFNLITLNGRQLASADAYPGDVGSGFVPSNSRSFNFANLSTTGIQSLEVHKTGDAASSTGGIGSTIDIRTVRPLSSPGLKLALNAQAIDDGSQVVSSTLTPQLSGIFSYADSERRWGVSLAADFQRRESGAADANVTYWDLRRWRGGPENLTGNARGDSNPNGLPLHVNNNSTPDPSDDTIDALVANAPADGQLYGIPSDIRYSVTDRRKQRVNGLLTLQYAPSDAFTLTADYLYAHADLEEDRSEQTVWFHGTGFTTVVFDTSAPVATPILIAENTGAGKDFAFDQQHRAQLNQLDEIGINAELAVSERLTFSLDLSSSRARSEPNDPLTSGNDTDFSVAGHVGSTGSCDLPNVCTNFWTQEFRIGKGLPLAYRTLFPTNLAALSDTGGDSNYTFGPSTLGTQVLRIAYSDQHSEARQARFDGKFQLEHSRLGFGIEVRSIESRYRFSNSLMTLGDWGVTDFGQVGSMMALLEPIDLPATFHDYSTLGIATTGFRGNADRLAQWAVTPTTSGGGGYGVWTRSAAADGELRFNPNFFEDRDIEENTRAAYVEWNLDMELSGRPAHLRAGGRYEETAVDSATNIKLPLEADWVSGGDHFIPIASTATRYAETAAYHYLLPSLDFDIDLTSSLKARLGWGRSIARQPYAQLVAGAVTDLVPAGATINGEVSTATSQNPGLLPLESTNLDVSLEWYFAENGYLAGTLWSKRVNGFTVTATDDRPLYGLRDPTAGPRARAARTELQRRGFEVTDAALFTMAALTENPNGFTDAKGVFWPGGAASYDGSDPQQLAVAKAYDILPSAGDPPYVFTVSRPVNGREARIHGWELAGQYFFGSTGVGVQANYTRVKGDIDYDVTADPSISQFVLPGLGDTANAALIYEKGGISARLAWNWRDEYLRAASVDVYHSPVIVDPYQQIDMSLAYGFNQHLQLSFEGINLTGANVRTHGRAEGQVWMLEQQAARYTLGIRYRL